MKVRAFVLAMTLAALAGIYLFVTAPPPLADARATAAQAISVRTLFELCNVESSTTRQLYTQAIVADGMKVGLEFDEHWQEADVHAGPLPALFLRETARQLERTRVGLGLFLGSDYPIQRANRFPRELETLFAQLRNDRLPRFFVMQDVDTQTGMFPDVAVSQACVDCHNRHPHSPKHDWQRNDVMGAVTWTYPHDTLTTEDALKVLAALRSSVAAAYQAYLAKASAFRSAPEIGNKWPSSGYALPSQAVFMDELARRVSASTLTRLLALH